MDDKEHNELIETFLNNSSIAKGGNIKIEHNGHTVSITPKEPLGYGMKYEDILYLDELRTGSEAFLYYLRREGYVIQKKRIDKSKKA